MSRKPLFSIGAQLSVGAKVFALLMPVSADFIAEEAFCCGATFESEMDGMNYVVQRTYDGIVEEPRYYTYPQLQKIFGKAPYEVPLAESVQYRTPFVILTSDIFNPEE